jgi:hypothetical protein
MRTRGTKSSFGRGPDRGAGSEPRSGDVRTVSVTILAAFLQLVFANLLAPLLDHSHLGLSPRGGAGKSVGELVRVSTSSDRP